MGNYSVIGCYGEGNLGDEAILVGLKHLIEVYDSNANYTIYVGSDKYRMFYTEDTVLDLKLTKVMHWYGLFLKGKILDIYKAMRRSDAIVIGGGELIRDDFGILPLLGIFEKAVMAKLFNKKLLLLGIGVGHITTIIGKILVRRIIIWADSVVVRDRESKNILRKLAPDSEINATSDVAFTLPLTNILGNYDKYLVAVSLRDWPSAWSSKTLKKDKQILLFDKFINKLASIFKTLEVEYQFKFLFIPFRVENGDDDRNIINDLINRANLINYKIANYNSDPNQVKKMISGCSLMIGMRLHACILSLSEGVPTLAINYDHKNTKLMKDLGLSKYVLDIYSVDNADYLSQIDDCHKMDRVNILSRVGDQVSAISDTYKVSLNKLKWS